jgi:hypothetical protein
VATRARRCGVGGVDRGIVLGIAFRSWINGAGPSESVDILIEDSEREAEARACEDRGRTEVAIARILRIG